MSFRRAPGSYDSRIQNSVFTKGALVIILSLGMFAYLAFTQAYRLFPAEEALSLPLWADFLNCLLKCMVMVAAMALLLYFYLIQDYHTALNELMDIFSVSESGKTGQDPYSRHQNLELIIDSASGIVRENQLYQSQLDSQKKLLLSNYLIRLMKGRVRDIPAAYESARTFGIDLHTGHLQVLIFGVREEGERPASEEQIDQIYDFLYLLIRNMLLAVFTGYLVEVDGMLACLLLASPEETLDSKDCVTELKRIAALIRQLTLEQEDYSVSITAGSVSAGLSGIEKSFSEAMELFQYARIMNEDDSILFYHNMAPAHTADTDDYFWFKKEMQFMNCINTADYQNAAAVFSEILDSEYLNSGLPLNLINCRMLGLINNMINALGKIRLTVDADYFQRLDPWHAILDCRSVPELKRKSQEIFNSINRYTEKQKSQSSLERMTEIVQYLKEHYQDPNLCVTSAAEVFELNPSYLSRIFKKLMGIGFSDYLQWVRVREAEALLPNKKLSIREISELTGFGGVQTMNRAFKKHRGTTAGKMRRF